jgi:methylated-DNA-[protein]-cysteine S-methyltransferase
MTIRYATFATPFGWCGLVQGDAGLLRVFLPERPRARLQRRLLAAYPGARSDRDSLAAVIGQFERYFCGSPVDFSARLDLGGATGFQKKVWSAAAGIPCGSVRTYGWVAGRIGMPRAGRAVGTALGHNPLPVIIPCHRVLRKDGGLGGFSAAQGVALKRKLLRLEGVRV